MNRLSKGALLGKTLASILASSLLLSTLPVRAADMNAVQDSDTTVKTLAPLPESPPESPTSQMPSPTEASKTKSTLQFTPEEVAPTPVASAQPAAGSEMKPIEAPIAANDQAPPVEAPTAGVEKSKPIAEESANAPAPPEVTAPQPLAGGSEPPVDTATVSGADATQLAQGAGGTRAPIDPAYRKLPTITGSVSIKRGFDRFPNNQLLHNLAFRDTPVKEVIADIGRRGNVNLIIDKSAVGRITGDLHDITLNEAMDTVLSSSGLQFRQMDNSTIIIGSPNALANLGLNRPLIRAFKLSYNSPFDVANILWASVFNRGFLPDFTQAVRNRYVNTTHETPTSKTTEEVARTGTAPGAGGGTQTSKSTSVSGNLNDSNEETETGEELNQTTRPDQARTIRGSQREQLNEGSGFNNAGTDPGSQTIRARVQVVTDFAVDQNGGGAMVIPDPKNMQILVVGTRDDLTLAEEAIRLIDRRPKQVHIQSSLIELSNQGIRQLGASLNLQGGGASGNVLGGAGAPLVNFLPGLGSLGQTVTQTLANAAGATIATETARVAGIPPIPLSFTRPAGAGTFTETQNVGLASVNGVPTNGFNGFLGAALPLNPPAIAGIQAVPQAQTGFNLLSLSKGAGGRANIATMPSGLNMSLNMVLQTNKAKILANPSVTVADNTESLITLANEVVHKITTTVSLGVVSVNVELVKAGIFLNVLPRVAEDGFITLRLRPQVSTPLGAPQIFAQGNVVVTLLNVREIISQEVRVKDGQTLVIGGLFSEQESATLAKVPYLAEAPILGAMFRNSIKGRNRTELLLLITPKVVEEQPPNAISDTASPTL